MRNVSIQFLPTWYRKRKDCKTIQHQYRKTTSHRLFYFIKQKG